MAVQSTPRVTKGKATGIDVCADATGVIRAAAMDQRGSLRKEIGKQGGQPGNPSQRAGDESGPELHRSKLITPAGRSRPA